MVQIKKQSRLDLTGESRVVDHVAVEKKGDTQGSYQAISLALSLGTSICVPIIIAAWIGHYIDGKINSSPVVTLILIILGVIVSIRGVYNQLKKFL